MESRHASSADSHSPASGESPAGTRVSAAAALSAALAPLAAWMPQQRWYVHKSAPAPQLSLVGHAVLHSCEERLVAIAILAAEVETAGGASRTIYQVPLQLRMEHAASAPDADGSVGASGDGPDAATVGTISLHGARLVVEDALRTDAGRRAVWELLIGGVVDGDGLRAVPAWNGADAPEDPGSTRILSGEQSNTSIILIPPEGSAQAPTIAKVFRVLQHGPNPDVVVQEALHAAGNQRIAPLQGSVLGEITGAEALSAHLVFAQQFLPGVEDAWRVALEEAKAGRSFAGPARALGTATAEVHRDLAAALPTAIVDETARAGMVAQMRERLELVAAEVPQVQGAQEQLAQVLEAARMLPWPPMQRIHGDYHLGQVLSVPERGWILLDFEGEPLRPLAQRSAPDSPLRDVAGMLRSLDYAAGSVLLTDGVDAAQWAAEARAAFWGGYSQTLGLDPHDEETLRLVAVFEADKAVYEALYEVRNRPDWLPIPLGAIERIVG